MSDLEERIRYRIIQKAELEGDFVRGDDGYWIFWPITNNGAYSAQHLRILADELDHRNSEYDRELNEYLVEQDLND